MQIKIIDETKWIELSKPFLQKKMFSVKINQKSKPRLQLISAKQSQSNNQNLSFCKSQKLVCKIAM